MCVMLFEGEPLLPDNSLGVGDYYADANEKSGEIPSSARLRGTMLSIAACAICLLITCVLFGMDQAFLGTGQKIWIFLPLASVWCGHFVIVWGKCILHALITK